MMSHFKSGEIRSIFRNVFFDGKVFVKLLRQSQYFRIQKRITIFISSYSVNVSTRVHFIRNDRVIFMYFKNPKSTSFDIHRTIRAFFDDFNQFNFSSKVHNFVVQKSRKSEGRSILIAFSNELFISRFEDMQVEFFTREGN